MNLKLLPVIGILLLLLVLFCGCTIGNNNGENGKEPIIKIKGFELVGIQTGLDAKDSNNTMAVIKIRVEYYNLDESYQLIVNCYYNDTFFSTVKFEDSDTKGTTGATNGLTIDVDGDQIPTKFTVTVEYKKEELDKKEYYTTKSDDKFGEI